jgi:hypothetical protein
MDIDPRSSAIPRVYVLGSVEGYRVRPAQVGVGGGLPLAIRFVNLTGDAIYIYVPAGVLRELPDEVEGGGREDPKAGAIAVAAGSGRTVAVDTHGLEVAGSVALPYTVYCEEGPDFAEGESCPEIIVER